MSDDEEDSESIPSLPAKTIEVLAEEVPTDAFLSDSSEAQEDPEESNTRDWDDPGVNRRDIEKSTAYE